MLLGVKPGRKDDLGASRMEGASGERACVRGTDRNGVFWLSCTLQNGSGLAVGGADGCSREATILYACTADGDVEAEGERRDSARCEEKNDVSSVGQRRHEREARQK